LFLRLVIIALNTTKLQVPEYLLLALIFVGYLFIFMFKIQLLVFILASIFLYGSRPSKTGLSLGFGGIDGNGFDF
jgi:hypothetical protein